jgi:hypothetical protein
MHMEHPNAKKPALRQPAAAPTNLVVPRHHYLSATTIRIGEDLEGSA